jgi:two-component system LytT family response regulator
MAYDEAGMTDPPTLRVLVADDEPLARARLTEMLSLEADVAVVGECRNGLEVVEAIAKEAPNLVLLDIQMPHMTGLEAVRTVGVDRMPRTIFVTAFGEFALQAFEVHAVDYLLKPFDEDRFRRAIARARSDLALGRRPEFEAELRSLLRHAGQAEYVQRLLVKRSSEYLFVRTADLNWIEASDNYLTLHTDGASYLIRESLGSLQGRLDPNHFVRIRAAAVVNLERVTRILPWSSTEFQFVLRDGTKVLSSRRYRDRIRNVIP